MQHELVSNENLFEIDGFKTGRIELPSFHLILDLSPDLYFRYDGLVQDLYEYAWDLGDRLYPEKAIILRVGVDLTKIGGFNKTYFLTENPTPKGCLMAVKNISPRINAINEAHESSEVAYSLGFVPELETHLKSLGFNLCLSQFTKGEIGIIGGVVGGLIHGFNWNRELLVHQGPGIEEEYGPIEDLVRASRTKIVQFPEKL